MEIIDRHTRLTTKDHSMLGVPLTVELDGRERAAMDRFDANTEAGMSVQEAAMQALTSMMPSARTKEFVQWMSQRTVTLTQDKRLKMVGSPRVKRPILTPEQVKS